jgi:hypothetical protein
MDNVKTLLSNYNQIKAEIQDLNIKLKTIKDLEDIGLKSIDYSRDKLSQTYRFTSVTEEGAINIVDKETAIKAMILDKQSIIDRLDNALSSLTEDEQQIIRSKIIQGRQWWQVAAATHQCERQCRRIAQAGISKVHTILHSEG